MALAVCLLFDARTERALRLLWQRLEDAGVPTLLSHTHGQHVPHLSYAVLRQFDVEQVREAVEGLPDGGPVSLHFDALGLFRRSRAWLVPGVAAVITGVSWRSLRQIAGSWNTCSTASPRRTSRQRLPQTPRTGHQAAGAAAST